MRISDWSSDVCSSDLRLALHKRTSARTYSVAAAFSEPAMTVLTASEARANLYRLMDQAAESHEPIVISGKRHSAVLISAEDWAAIQENLFLLSVPGMRESIKAGMAEPVEPCSAEPDWWVVAWRQDGRRVGTECVSKCRYRGWRG